MPIVRFSVWLVLANVALSAHATVSLTSFGVGTPTSTQAFASVGASLGPGAEVGTAEVWPVSVDLALLSTLPPTLVINFPDRAAVSLIRGRSERRGPQAYSWSGRGDSCSAALTVQGSAFAGAISCPNASYGVSRANTGLGQRLTRFNQAQLPDELPPVVAGSAAIAAPSAAPSSASAPTGVDTDIDVLVLYTEGVRQALDGPSGNVNTQTFARNAVEQTQQAFDNSSAAATVKMVHAQWVSRADSGNVFDDLDYLNINSFPTGLRNYWAADIAVLLTYNGTNPMTCGVANVPRLGQPGLSFAELALAVVEKSCAIANFSFAHELAHTLGANHNPENAPNPYPAPGPVEPWAFGHWRNNSKGGLRTIMTYPQSAALCTIPCPRILNYSNASIWVEWFQTGVANLRENARVISETAPLTAQYRASRSRIFADGFEL